MSSRSHSRRRRHCDPVRRVAYTALLATETRGAYTNLALAEQLRMSALTGRDAAFATELVDGTARGTGSWDRIITAAGGRPASTLQPGVRVVLRMTCHQVLQMRVPTHAAVGTSVDLAAHVIGERVTGLVNAVARKISLHGLPEWAEIIAPDDPVEQLAIASLHPRWIVTEYAELLDGEEPLGIGNRDADGGTGPSEVRRALMADNIAATPTLVVRPGLATVDELLAQGASACEYSRFGAHRAGNPREVPAVADGRAGVQDEGSQLVATALADACDVDGPWVDICAGPGGKAALLAGLAAEHHRFFAAGELHPHRARLVANALAPIPGDHAVLVADGTHPPVRPGVCAAVMTDVPCSGLGALRRRPESRWRERDLEALVLLQRSLLHNAIALARPGGVIGYVTCSPHHRETTEVVCQALRHEPVEALDTPSLMAGVPDCATGPDGRFVQLWPHRHGTDAMFCAVLRRTS
ncbi:MAG: transcription antitermination factor NusB [Cutibacterium granulosum]|nr:transcription antitermination factor NusB [Cutibacterium granulosum]